MNGISLFAGVGGFDLAMQRLGIRTVAAVEIDAAARAVLALHKQMGNAVAVPCPEWTLRRLVAVDAALDSAAGAA